MKTNETEQSKLAECEAAIERTLGAFQETGQALLKIRDEKLYRATHETFEKYCRERWGISRPRAYELIASVDVMASLSGIPDKPKNMGQIEELLNLEPEQRREVWKAAVETAPHGNITAAHVRESRESLIKSPEQETLFTLEDYRQAIDHHVSAANHHRSISKYHIRQAVLLRDKALKKFGVQLSLQFEFEGEIENEIDSAATGA